MTFQETLWKELNQLGKGILTEVLEAKDQYLLDHQEERPGWGVVRRNDPKAILTLFGETRYQGTYYHHHTTFQYAHLVDRYAGYQTRQRIDPLVEGEVLEKAIDLSYRKSGEQILPENEEVIVSPKGVKKIIHTFKKEEAFRDWEKKQ